MLTGWGVLPYLHLGPWRLPSYTLLLTLAFLAGTAAFLLQARGPRRPGTLAILAAALAGGILGAKLPYLPGNLRLALQGVRDPEVVLAGRTVIGGMLGGALAVRLAKRWLGLQGRRGDTLVPAIALGLAIGRIGCFLRGCCAGVPTSLPWGVDFGDGVPRHPTQVYESLFALAWFLATVRRPKGDRGQLFDLFMTAFFSWRFLMEFLRTEPVAWLGLTAFQWVCLPAAAWAGWKWRTGLRPEAAPATP